MLDENGASYIVTLSVDSEDLLNFLGATLSSKLIAK